MVKIAKLKSFLYIAEYGTSTRQNRKIRCSLWLCWERSGKSISYWAAYSLSRAYLYGSAYQYCWGSCSSISGKNDATYKNMPTTGEKNSICCSENSDMTYTDAFIYANGIVLLNAINGFVLSQYSSFGYNNGTKVRIAVCSMIYRKVTSVRFLQHGKDNAFRPPQPNLLRCNFYSPRLSNYHTRHWVAPDPAKLSTCCRMMWAASSICRGHGMPYGQHHCCSLLWQFCYGAKLAGLVLLAS